MSTPTKLDAYGRDRVLGPKEQAYARRGTVLTWVAVACGVVAAIAWLQYSTVAGSRWSMEYVVPIAWAATATILGAAVLAARVVVGALRAAAEGARE